MLPFGGLFYDYMDQYINHEGKSDVYCIDMI